MDNNQTIRVYNAIVAYKLAHNGASPTLDEIGRACGLGKGTANYHVGRLAESGLLVRGDGARALQVPALAIVVRDDAHIDRDLYADVWAMAGA